MTSKTDASPRAFLLLVSPLQSQVKFEQTNDRITVEISGKVLLMENRRMTFYAEPVYRIVDFDFELIAVTGVTFGRCGRYHARRLLPH